MRTLKILGYLVTYPTAMHQDVMDECRDLLQKEKWLSNRLLNELYKLMHEIEQTSLLDLQERYVDLFDRTPSLSLHLFEHVHGDSRDRGPALVDLTRAYEQAGLYMTGDDTPDYLPIFLEYLSMLDPKEIKDNLGNAVNVIAALGERLKKRGSSYSAVFEALVETASRKPDAKAVKESLAEASGEAYDFDQLDEEWKEQFAFDKNAPFNNQADGCPKAQEMIARMEASMKERETGQ